MAARLSLDERVFESSLGAGRSVDVARRLGRDRSTVHRELARCAGRARPLGAMREGATRANAQAAVDRVLAAAAMSA